MAKIFRVSGYLVDVNEVDTKENIKNYLKNTYDFNGYEDIWQQLHVEESESFELDGEDEENCDLALLTRHFKKDIQEGLERKVVVGGNYRHFKEGKVVKVIGISRNTETEEVSVVYEYEGMIWNRPIQMFLSEVDHEKYQDAKQKYRFEMVETDDVIDEDLSDAEHRGYVEGYNKAIDDAKYVILQSLGNEQIINTLHLRLDQLKEGETDA